jgi:hypothetical protein
MLNLALNANAMPCADETEARRAQFNDFSSQAVALAVRAIGAGLDVKADVIIAASYPLATNQARALISDAAVEKGDKLKKKDIFARVLVGLILDGRPVFRDLSAKVFAFDSLGAARDAQGIQDEIERARLNKHRFLTTIENFLNNADKVAQLANNKTNRALCRATFQKATEALCFEAYKAFAAPLAIEVMKEAKKVAKVNPDAKVKTFAEKLESYINKQEESDAGLTEMDLAEAITLLTARHNELVSRAALAVERAAVAAANENAEPELKTGTNG